MKQHYLYLVINQINKKAYIGQHITTCKSIRSMIKDGYYGSGKLILKAIKKYGKENFSKYIIAVYKTQADTDQAEIDFIKKYNVLENKDLWYNRDSGGQYGRSEDHRELTSKAMKQVWQQPGYRQKFIDKGLILSDKDRELKKLRGMRIYLINTLKAVKNIKIKEWDNSPDGKSFHKEYAVYCGAEHIKQLNQWQKTLLARSIMSDKKKGIKPYDVILSTKLKIARANLKGNNTWLSELLIDHRLIPGELAGQRVKYYTNGNYKTYKGLCSACKTIQEKAIQKNIQITQDQLISAYIKVYGHMEEAAIVA